MSIVYLLSAAEFKTYTPVHGNVDDKFIQQSILACQDMYVTDIVGTDLYNYLIANVASLPANYKILLQNYLHKGMRYWIMSELCMALDFRLVNVGVQEKYTDASNALDRSNLFTYRDDLRSKAEYFANKTKLYLCANETLFPEYSTSGNTVDSVVPKKQSFTSSIYLGNGKRKAIFPIIDDNEDCC